jgi:DNA polymerase III alpha subunit
VARCLEIPFSEINELTKLLPNVYKDEKGETKPITIKKALELEPKLKDLQASNPVYKEVIDIAQKLEGLYRQAGMHAAGIVIADSHLWDFVPVFRGTDDELITQFSMSDVEQAGLVKFDFLGLKTLDVIYYAEQHINERLTAELQAKDVDKLWQTPAPKAPLGQQRGPAAAASHLRRGLRRDRAVAPPCSETDGVDSPSGFRCSPSMTPRSTS